MDDDFSGIVRIYIDQPIPTGFSQGTRDFNTSYDAAGDVWNVSSMRVGASAAWFDMVDAVHANPIRR